MKRSCGFLGREAFEFPLHPHSGHHTVPLKAMTILTKPPQDDGDFEVVEIFRQQWAEQVKPYLGEKRKMVIPEFFFSDTKELETLADESGFQVAFLPQSPSSGIGRIYLTPV